MNALNLAKKRPRSATPPQASPTVNNIKNVDNDNDDDNDDDDDDDDNRRETLHQYHARQAHDTSIPPSDHQDDSNSESDASIKSATPSFNPDELVPAVINPFAPSNIETLSIDTSKFPAEIAHNNMHEPTAKEFAIIKKHASIFAKTVSTCRNERIHLINQIDLLRKQAIPPHIKIVIPKSFALTESMATWLLNAKQDLFKHQLDIQLATYNQRNRKLDDLLQHFITDISRFTPSNDMFTEHVFEQKINVRYNFYRTNPIFLKLASVFNETMNDFADAIHRQKEIATKEKLRIATNKLKKQTASRSKLFKNKNEQDMNANEKIDFLINAISNMNLSPTRGRSPLARVPSQLTRQNSLNRNRNMSKSPSRTRNPKESQTQNNPRVRNNSKSRNNSKTRIPRQIRSRSRSNSRPPQKKVTFAGNFRSQSNNRRPPKPTIAAKRNGPPDRN